MPNDYLIDYLLLLFLLKIKNFIKIMNKLAERYALEDKSIFIINLGKLFMFVLLMGHIFASIWLFVGN